jgi:hypothetical protein
LTLTDSTGEYDASTNPTGWDLTGNDVNPDVADIVGSTTTTALKYHLKLDVIVTDKNGLETTYDTIDLYDHNGTAFSDTDDLTWQFNASDFVESSTAMGVASAKLTDGIYNITYSLVDAPTDLVIEDSIEQSITIDGDVRLDVYNKLRQVSKDYENENNDKSRDHMEALLSYTYLQGLLASTDTSQIEELYTQLYTLDKLVSDGSNYTW